MLWKKMTSFARLIKNNYEDQLWLFAIILMMLLLAIAGLTNWDNVKETKPQPLAQAVQSTKEIRIASKEISLAQVQAIVSKPMADLMVMQVYDDENRVQNTYELVAQSAVDNSISENGANREAGPIYLSEASLYTEPRLN